MRYVLAMVLMVTSATAEEFPQQCYKELMLVVLKEIEPRCKGLQVTFAGHKQKVYLSAKPDLACVSVAESKTRSDFEKIQEYWCPRWMKWVNGKEPEPYVEAR